MIKLLFSKYLISFSLIPLLSISIFSQNNLTLVKNVIAVEGLNLRSHPNLKSKIIATIPYLKQVTIEDEQSYSFDTIGYYTYYGENYRRYDDYVTGKWVKVKYDKKSGYVFDAYLRQLNSKPHQTKLLKSRYGLSFIGQDGFVATATYLFDLFCYLFNFFRNGHTISIEYI